MLERYRSSIFIRGFVSLFTGSAAAQLIPLILSPFIARMFSIEEIALYGIYFSIVSIFSVIAGGRYEMAIVLPKSEKSSIRLVHLVVILSVCFSVFSGIVFCAFGREIASWLNNDQIYYWFWLIPISFLMNGIYQAMNFWLIRQKAFVAASLNKVGQRGFEGIGILGFGHFGFNGGLIVSDLIGRASMVLISFYQVIKKGFGETRFDLSQTIQLSRKYRSFPLFFGPSSLANAVAAQVPILFISSAYLAETVGFFNLMKYVLSAPVAFISRNVAQVFLERLAEKWRNNKPIMHDFHRLTILMTVIALCFVLPISIFGQHIFQFFFGDQWTEAGQYAQIMAFTFGVKFVVSPMSALLNAVNKISVVSIWQWSYLGVILTLIPVSHLGWSIIDFLLYYCVAESLIYIVYWGLTYKEARAHDQKIKKVQIP